MTTFQDSLSAYKALILLISALSVLSTSILLAILFRLAQILPTPTSGNTFTATTDVLTPKASRPPPSQTHPTHLLIVLGSGGHTAEMLNVLHTIPLSSTFTHRTYLISTGDSFSATKAVEFEKQHASANTDPKDQSTYSIVTVRRARRVHQPFLTTPITAILSLWDCIAVLRGTHHDNVKIKEKQHIYPDLILTNGPGTGVCVVLAALILRFFGYSGPSSPSITIPQQQQHQREIEAESKMIYHPHQGQMRMIFIESWARVRTLSLSGKILQPLVNRFLVQWPQLKEVLGEGVEYIGPLVS